MLITELARAHGVPHLEVKLNSLHVVVLRLIDLKVVLRFPGHCADRPLAAPSLQECIVQRYGHRHQNA
jgi:hypothetical protein